MKTSFFKKMFLLLLTFLLTVPSFPTWAAEVDNEPPTGGMTVNLRIEGIQETVIEPTTVALSPSDATQPGNLTPLDAVIKKLNEEGIAYKVDYFTEGDPSTAYISSINGETAFHFGGWDGWIYKIFRNGEMEPSADNYGMATFPLQDGDTILLYYGDFGIPVSSVTLDPTQTQLGETVTATVTEAVYGEPIEGATVHFGELTATTDAQGKASYTPGQSGTFDVFAEMKDEDGKSLIVRSAKKSLDILPAPEALKINLRIEGIGATVIEPATVSLAPTDGAQPGILTPLDAVVKKLNAEEIEHQVDYFTNGDLSSAYISSINGETAYHFGGWDGWLYKIIRNGEMEPTADNYGMAQYSLQNGDSILLYYGDFGIPVASVTLDQAQIQAGETVTATVTDFAAGSPIEGATVHFGELTATTDAQGETRFTTEQSGTHNVFAEKKDGDGKSLIVRSTKQSVKVTATSNQQPVYDSIDSTLDYYETKGAPSSDWVAFGLNASGEDIDKAPYLNSNGKRYADQLVDQTPKQMTDWARNILGILSAGFDPTNFNSKNYIYELMNHSRGLNEGMMAAIYSLIAMDASGQSDISGSKYTREQLINFLKTNRSGKGWSLSSGSTVKPDPDVTAMALIALAPHQNRSDIQPLIEEGLSALKEMQQPDGGFGVTSESTSQAIQALTTLGIDPNSEQFTVSNGNNPISALLNYQLPNGGFRHLPPDSTLNSIATEQALIALASLKSFYQNGISDIYINVAYQGAGTPLPPSSSKVFTLDSPSLSQSNGIKATINVTPINGGHSGKETVIFQLMNGTIPESIVAMEKDITAPEQMAAYFNKAGGTYSVKVFIVDSFADSPNNLGNSLSDTVIIE